MAKKILLLGGTGRTGLLLISEALRRGLEVVALVRRPKTLGNSKLGLTVEKGDVLSAEDMYKAMGGCDVVINTLSMGVNSPFQKPPNALDFQTQVTKNVVTTMNSLGLKRYILMGAAGAGEGTLEHQPFVSRLLARYSTLSKVFADHDGQEKVIMSSDLDWTIARATVLGGKARGKPVRVSYDNQPKPSMMVSREDVALFLLDCIEDQNFFQKAPTISRA